MRPSNFPGILRGRPQRRVIIKGDANDALRSGKIDRGIGSLLEAIVEIGHFARLSAGEPLSKVFAIAEGSAGAMPTRSKPSCCPRCLIASASAVGVKGGRGQIRHGDRDIRRPWPVSGEIE